MATRSSGTAPSSASLCEDDLGVLYEALFPARNKYRKLALQIGVKISQIESVEMKESDPGDRLLQILAICLKKRDILTWKDIDTALRTGSVDENKLADAIRKKYSHLYLVASPDGSSEDEHEKEMPFEKEKTKKEKKDRAMHHHRMSEALVQQDSDAGVSKRKGRKKQKRKESECEEESYGEVKFKRIKETNKQYYKVSEKEKETQPEREVYKRQEMKATSEVHEIGTSNKHNSPSKDEKSKKQREVNTESDSETSSDESPKFVREKEEKMFKAKFGSKYVEKQQAFNDSKHENESKKTSNQKSIKQRNESDIEMSKKETYTMEVKKSRKTSLCQKESARKSESAKCKEVKSAKEKYITIPQKEESVSSRDDSSPECDVVIKQYESEMKKLLNIFERFFGKLCCVEFSPKDVAAELRKKELISINEMKHMMQSPESQQVKIISLVDKLHNKIRSHPGHLFELIEVMLENKALQGTAKEMLYTNILHM